MSAAGPAAPWLHTPETLPAGDGPLRLELSCPQGRAQVTRYPVFPGIDLAYYDVHAPACALEEPVPGLLRISHCREGRMEYLHGGRFYFLAPGDLSVSCAQDPPREARFPTGHYHGITVTIDNSSRLVSIMEELRKYGTVETDPDMCIICVVGDLRWGNVGYESLVSQALSNVPVRMISYGGSNHNISFLVRQADKKKALQALSEHLFNKK